MNNNRALTEHSLSFSSDQNSGLIVLMRATIASLALAATGCATVDKITLPGGAQALAISSSKPSRVYNKAAEVCAPGTYEIVDKSATPQGGFANGIGAVETQTTLIVRCVK